jgi:hypothetical protein
VHHRRGYVRDTKDSNFKTDIKIGWYIPTLIVISQTIYKRCY